MERVKVTVVCDRCEQDTDLNPGSGVMLAFDHIKAEVDLCDDCRKFVFRELEQILDNGRSLNPPATKVRKERVRALCPDCQQYFLEGAGMTLHRMKKHPEKEESHEYAEATG